MSAYWQNVSEGFAFVGTFVGLLGSLGGMMLFANASWELSEEGNLRGAIKWAVIATVATLAAVSLAIFCGSYLAVTS